MAMSEGRTDEWTHQLDAARVDDGRDVINGDAGLSDVGGDDNFSLFWQRTLENALLRLPRQAAVQRQYPQAPSADLRVTRGQHKQTKDWRAIL
jgi:hypothetical protein